MNTTRLQSIRNQQGYHILNVKPGQQIEIHERVGQGSNERVWRFKALVLKVKKPNHADGTFTVRGKVAGMTIEKIYPLSFGQFEKVILLDEYKVRRAKLYYLRDKVGKGARMKSIATAEEKGRDLLAEAIAAAQAQQPTPVEEPVVTEDAAPAEATTPEQTSEETPTDEGTTAEQPTDSETSSEEAQSEESATEVATDAPAEDAPTDKTPAEESSKESKE